MGRLPPRFMEALVSRDGVGCLAGLMKGDFHRISCSSIVVKFSFELSGCTTLPSVSTFVKI